MLTSSNFENELKKLIEIEIERCRDSFESPEVDYAVIRGRVHALRWVLDSFSTVNTKLNER
jgi:hypothetical protein